MLKIVPISLKDANSFVLRLHRHHKPTVGHKFSVAISDDTHIKGVVIASRPIARMNDNGLTLEVTRCCTDGTPNACSMLYRAAWRVSKEMGYTRLITYTLKEEPGTSLKASGFKLIGLRGGGSWNRKSRPRDDKHPLQEKLLWEINCMNKAEATLTQTVKEKS